MPKIADIRLRLAAGAVFAIWFWIVYIGCDYIAQGFEHRHSVSLGLDAALPFIPEFAVAYMGVNVMLLLPLVVIRDTARLLALAATLSAEVAIAGAIYLVFPVEAPITPGGHGSAILGTADMVNLTYNAFPSLHVALTVSIGIAMAREFRFAGRLVLLVAVAAIAASTVLTKQHFVADAISGLVLAVVAMAVIFPMARRKAASLPE
ncbi:MAG: phosphatase PAP2 family protein [Oricola sp.]